MSMARCPLSAVIKKTDRELAVSMDPTWHQLENFLAGGDLAVKWPRLHRHLCGRYRPLTQERLVKGFAGDQCFCIHKESCIGIPINLTLSMHLPCLSRHLSRSACMR
ncbi:hypothetical protein BCR44DRAFT_358172 [Catenaria anguillulae PL171]|uniref:Uncharacterized protein n=1 Tax=Catenaria anguillulae PL171 TaxID=765915 RepID=A0A1Y2H7L3_9FUNG|nr:hypothetical protein BCR44DRAFT_358172 [Catenaria anguillulae PL171]